jgi:hypothetical protein
MMGQVKLPELTAIRRKAYCNRRLSLGPFGTTDPIIRGSLPPVESAYRGRVLNGMVFELYFPEEVHGAGLRLVEQSKLPDINTLAESQHLPTLREKFADLHDPHRIALDKLQSLDTVRIIEGKV